MSSAAPVASLAVDGLTPRSVVEPRSVEELAAALAAANANDEAVIPWGAGAHMSLGNIPSRYDVALRTTKLDRVIGYEPADLTVTVEAGITMGRLQSLLAEHGQSLPIDAPAEATVGGVLAANVSGPSRHAYGLPRDWLIGCRVALADGTVIKGGGRVVKNVAGYDLPKLFVGALGTLGVIVEATFKLAPLPPAQETLVLRFRSREQAFPILRDLNELELAARAFVGRRNKDEITLAFWLAGAQGALDRSRSEIESLIATADVDAKRLQDKASDAWWSRLAEQWQARDDTMILRASFSGDELGGFLAGVGPSNVEDDPRTETLECDSTGWALVRCHSSHHETLVDFVGSARELAAFLQGSVIVTSAPVEVKQRIDVWGDVDALPLMRRLKQQFDPKGTLSPGRFVGGI